MARCDVAIVGGGPVGLLLGGLLAQRGLDVRVLERTLAPRDHSRAIGIHPPGLAALAEVGAADAVLGTGVRVRRGLAFGNGRALGHVSFACLPGPYPFVLCAPQSQTERALEARLNALAPGALSRDAEVTDCSYGAGGATLKLRGELSLRARFVVGCDGKHSRVRAAAGIRFVGKPYREHFVMADVADDTPYGHDAAVFVAPGGVVESFPLPDGQRRWVVGLGARTCTPTAALVEQLVAQRTGQLARADSATMVSTFTAEQYLADRFSAGPIALAGDAAHIISPIGGQGMNLGWLDAKLLADLLIRSLHEPEHAGALLATYTHARRRAARAARRRSELFMALGRTLPFQRLRELTVSSLLSGPLADHAAQVFAMRGLDSAPA